MRRNWLLLPMLASLVACSDAKTPSEVAPELVSPSMYRGMSCRELRAEARSVQEATPALAAAVDKEYKNDKAMEAVTWILFWPAAFAMDGNDAEAAQLARAKGQLKAITEQMKSKGCKA